MCTVTAPCIALHTFHGCACSCACLCARVCVCVSLCVHYKPWVLPEQNPDVPGVDMQGLVGIISNPVLANGVAGLATSATAQSTIEVTFSSGKRYPLQGSVH